MHNAVWTREIPYGQSDGAKSEFRKRRKNAMRVFSVRFDENIYIPRVTGGAVKSQRITADYQVFNVVGVEQPEQLFEVWLNLHYIGYVNSQRPRRALRASGQASRQGRF